MAADAPLDGALVVVTVPLLAAATSRVLFNRSCRLMGWSVIEPSGSAAAAFLFYEGQDNTGSVVGGLSIPQAGDSNHGFGPYGMVCIGGLYLLRNAGTITGSVTVAAEAV